MSFYSRKTRRHAYSTGLAPFNIWRDYKSRPSTMVLEGCISISREYSCLDFVPIENRLKEEITTRESYLLTTVRLWSLVFLVGISIGTLGAILTIITDEIYIFKNNLLNDTLNKSPGAGYSFWAAYILIPVSVCAAIIVYFEPNAKGVGLARVIGYLNGINMEEFKSFRTAVVEYFAIILAKAAGLFGGGEEPFIHFGSVLAGSFCRLSIAGWKPFNYYAGASGARDLVTAGASAAVSVAFGTPIGAVLFCLEEGITYWNARLTYIMFVCCVVSALTLNLMRTLILKGCSLTAPIEHHAFFSDMNEISLNYKLHDVPMFILFGIIGALIGSLWSACYVLLNSFRKKFLKFKHLKYGISVAFGVFLLSFSVILFNVTRYDCVSRYENSTKISDSKEINVYCENGLFQSMGVFLFQDARNTLKSLARNVEKGVSLKITFIGFVYHFVNSVLLCNTDLPSGILIPNLIMGGCWGHILASWLLPPGSMDTVPQSAKYTFFGALAQASGVTRFTLSLGVIIIESSCQANYAVPVFIVVLSAKWFGGLISEPIFRTVAYLSGYPLIRSSLLPVSSAFNTTSIMSPKLASLPATINTTQLILFLEENFYHFYPITSGGKIVGIMSRNQIFTLLEILNQIPPQDEKEKKELNDFFTYYEGYSFKKLKKAIKSGGYTCETRTLNLEAYCNRFPYLIHEKMSLRRIYSFFLSLGAAYAIAIDDSCNPVGIISRKDVARFRRLEQFLLVRTEVVPIA